MSEEKSTYVTKRKRGRPKRYTRTEPLQVLLDPETRDLFNRANRILQNRLPESLQTIKVTKADTFRAMLDFFIKGHKEDEA